MRGFFLVHRSCGFFMTYSFQDPRLGHLFRLDLELGWVFLMDFGSISPLWCFMKPRFHVCIFISLGFRPLFINSMRTTWIRAAQPCNLRIFIMVFLICWIQRYVAPWLLWLQLLCLLHVQGLMFLLGSYFGGLIHNKVCRGVMIFSLVALGLLL